MMRSCLAAAAALAVAMLMMASPGAAAKMYEEGTPRPLEYKQVGLHRSAGGGGGQTGEVQEAGPDPRASPGGRGRPASSLLAAADAQCSGEGKVAAAEARRGEDDCPICLEPVEGPPQLEMNGCDHGKQFHLSCLLVSLASGNLLCPVCKGDTVRTAASINGAQIRKTFHDLFRDVLGFLKQSTEAFIPIDDEGVRILGFILDMYDTFHSLTEIVDDHPLEIASLNSDLEESLLFEHGPAITRQFLGRAKASMELRDLTGLAHSDHASIVRAAVVLQPLMAAVLDPPQEGKQLLDKAFAIMTSALDDQGLHDTVTEICKTVSQEPAFAESYQKMLETVFVRKVLEVNKDLSDSHATSMQELAVAMETSGVHALTLRGSGLRSLPTSIDALAGQLTSLELSYTDLQDLPESFGHLASLKTLGFDQNHRLAAEGMEAAFLGLSTHGALEELRLENMKDELKDIAFKALPTNLGHLASLKTLHVGGNNLAAEGMETAFSGLSAHEALEELRLNDNDLDELPEALGRLKVRKLDLSDNRLTAQALESTLDGLSDGGRLENLYLNGNPLVGDPFSNKMSPEACDKLKLSLSKLPATLVVLTVDAEVKMNGVPDVLLPKTKFMYQLLDA